MLRLEGISRTFGQFRAVSDVSFTVSPGTVLGLLGPNGAGKTTLIRIVAGTLAPTAGRVVVDGFDMQLRPGQAKSQVGVLFPDGGLAERLDAIENVTLFGTLYGLSEAEARERARRLLDRLELRSAHRPVGTYSKGMRQKVALARALVHAPSVVVLDEPTSGLDVVSAAALEDFVRTLRAEGKAVLLASHNLDQVERLCDRVAMLNHGQLVMLAPVSELSGGGRTVADALLSALKGECAGHVTA